MKKLAIIFLAILLISFSGFTQTIKDIDYISLFNEGVAAIKKGNKWEIIETNNVIENYLTKEGVNVVLDKKFLPEPPKITSKFISDNLIATINKSNKWSIKK